MWNKLRLFSLALLLLPQFVFAINNDEDELLAPDDAFKIEASQTGAGEIEVRWQIAEGYYLYRSKFKFNPATEGVTLGEAQLPPGKVKQDEFFGEVETYRGPLSVPMTFEASAMPDTLALDVVSQGCADVGVCYPPQKKTLQIALNAQAAAPAAPANQAPAVTGEKPGAGGLSVLDSLKGALGANDPDELLPADEAFAFSARLEAPNFLVTEWRIAEGYYLYKDKIKPKTDTITLGDPQYPPSKRLNDPNFGDVEIYRGLLTLKYPITSDIQPFKLDIVYQGCADMGVCYPPEKKSLNFDAANTTGTASTAGAQPLAAATSMAGMAATNTPSPAANTPAAAATTADQAVSEQDAIAATLAGDSSMFVIAATFFGFGLLLALTPCVFPMIPILSGIIVGHGHKTSTSKALMLSVAYVLAMALTYTIVGVLAGLFGANIQAWFQNPWILSSFAAIFVLLSLSMFGFYELQMPASIQSKLTNISNKQEGGKFISAAIMGFLSALIVGPCVTAPLIGALIYIGQTGDAVIGGLALFSLSMGMGAPLLIIGASAGRLLPKAGAWMDAVKAVFGVLMLGIAIWMLERILPAPVILMLWGILFVVSGIYMGALRHIDEQKSGWFQLWKGLGFVLLLYGSLLIIGAAAGGKDVLQPLKGSFTSSAAVETQEAMFLPIKSSADLDAAIASANNQGKPVMLDFYADWCISCKELERYTFSDPAVQQTLSSAVLLKADVTANDDVDQALMKRFGIIGPPAILFFNTQGEERKASRLVGFLAAEPFQAHASKALAP